LANATPRTLLLAAHRLLLRLPMRLLVVIPLAIVLGLAAAPASATPISGGLDYTTARGGALEHWDLGWRLEAGLFLQVGPWHATGSLSGLMHVRSDLPERDGDDLTGLGLGGRIAYHHTIDRHGVLLVALGLERIWLDGHDPVQRGCRQTDACLFGYYTETPSYNAWAPQLRVGIGAFAPPPDLKLGATFEIIVEPIAMHDVPPDGVRGIALFAALTATVGGGTRN
jgi:hypothetical protein